MTHGRHLSRSCLTAGCFSQTWLGKVDYPGYNATLSSQTSASCQALCVSESRCQFFRISPDGVCSLRGTPNITSGNAPNASVAELCFPNRNCEC